MRLIDADKLKEEIGECPENWLDSPEEMQAVDDWKSIMELINAAPTIEAETETAKEILAMLTEQEKKNKPMQVTYTENIITYMPVAHCPRCGKFLTQLFADEEEETKFCPWCGLAVKWE